ncbi:MAG: glycosyltransferase family 2 protein [Patescibacteria group bacterium]|jgi:GT2 family glycosyltransferase
MNQSINFSLIIPNFNGEKYLINCLDSLIKSISIVNNSKFELILVDNASKDSSVNIFCRNIPKKYYSKVILNNKNLGFAAAVNQGIKTASYSYVVLINNDLTLDHNWFKKVRKEIIDNPNNNIAAYCGTVLNTDGTLIESQGFKYHTKGKCHNISNGKKFNKSILQEKPKIIWGAPAALIVYKKNIIEKIGLFDEDFFAYEEDVDLALRLNMFGYKTRYIPSAVSYHLGGGTSNLLFNLRSRMTYRNWYFIIIKNYELKKIIINLPQIILERFRNLSYLTRQTIKICPKPKIIHILKTTATVSLEIILLAPKMLNKRFHYQKLLKKG